MNKSSSPRFIVAELSKNWEAPVPGQSSPPPVLLAHAFEQLLNINFARGYRLWTWQLHRILHPNGNELNETIVAVFEREAKS